MKLVRCLIEMAYTALLSRAPFPLGVYPAGIAYGLFSGKRSFIQELAILTGIFLGTSSIAGVVFGLKLAVVLAVYKILQKIFSRKWTSFFKWLLPFCWLGLRVGLVGSLPDTEHGLIIVWETAAAYFLIPIYQMVFKFLDFPLKHSRFADIALLASVLIAISGSQNLFIESVEISDVLSVVLITTAAYLGGGGAGAVMGILLAMVLGMTAGGILTLIVLYAVPGMCGGFLKRLGRWGTVIGSSFGLYWVLHQLHAPVALSGDVLPWGIGMAAFYTIPPRYMSQVSGYFPETAAQTDNSEKQKYLIEIITLRLNEVALAFADFSRGFQEEACGEEQYKIDLYSFLDKICNEICQHCNGYGECWGENFYSTYREMFDLIAQAELEGEIHAIHLKGRLSRNCFQQFKLINTVNQLIENNQPGFYWQRKIGNSKALLAEQMQGVSDFLKNMAAQITRDSMFKAEMEVKLKAGFARAGIHIKQIDIASFGQEGLEVRIKRRSCNQKHECQWMMAPVVGSLLGTEYIVWEKLCNLGKDECAYCLIPKRAYRVKTTVCKLPKEGNERSGDSHALHEIKDGFFVSILSDGMGHGSRAELESNSTVSILERLLDTGIESDFAVKMVNSMVALRSPEESFATVDLTIIDLYSGMADFLKVGAAATYVKRGREIWTINSTSLPAGILNTVDVEKTTMPLQTGDLVIMVTDGVIDSRLDVAGKEEWMKRALSKVEVVGPEALGEYLLNLARINQDGAPKDDMTVIVIQLTENITYSE